MKVEELMSQAKCCGEQDTVRAAARLMKEESIGFVPVCNDEGEPVGAVTDRDLAIRVLAEGRSADERLEACMTRDVAACKLGDDLGDVERLMREKRISRVMVCDDAGKLRGVVSFADLAEAQDDAELGETLEQVKSDPPSASI